MYYFLLTGRLVRPPDLLKRRGYQQMVASGFTKMGEYWIPKADNCFLFSTNSCLLKVILSMKSALLASWWYSLSWISLSRKKACQNETFSKEPDFQSLYFWNSNKKTDPFESVLEFVIALNIAFSKAVFIRSDDRLSYCLLRILYIERLDLAESLDPHQHHAHLIAFCKGHDRLISRPSDDL